MQYNKQVGGRKPYTKSDGRRLMSGGPRDLQRKQQIQQAGSPDSAVVEELRNQIRELTTALAQKPAVEAEDFDAALRKSVEDAVSETKSKYKKEIRTLREELAERDNEVPQGYFSPEQMDEEINKAVSVVLTDAKFNTDQAVKEATNKLTSLLNNKADEYDELNTAYEKLILTSDTKIEKLETRIEVLEEKIKDKEKTILVLEEKTTAPLDLDDTRIAELVAQRISIDSDGSVYDPNQPKMKTSFIDPSEVGAEDKFEGKIDAEDVVTEEKVNISDKADKLKSLIGKLPKVV